MVGVLSEILAENEISIKKWVREDPTDTQYICEYCHGSRSSYFRRPFAAQFASQKISEKQFTQVAVSTRKYDDLFSFDNSGRKSLEPYLLLN